MEHDVFEEGGLTPSHDLPYWRDNLAMSGQLPMMNGGTFDRVTLVAGWLRGRTALKLPPIPLLASTSQCTCSTSTNTAAPFIRVANFTNTSPTARATSSMVYGDLTPTLMHLRVSWEKSPPPPTTMRSCTNQPDKLADYIPKQRQI